MFVQPDMEESMTIAKINTPSNAADYFWLQREALRYIESLSKKVWTDYNVHDPGITIMEVLVWAFTEGGYKLDFDIKDLLARLPGDLRKDFYTAKQILTNNPTTIIDLRKYCIDIEGIQNTWFQKHYYPLDDSLAANCIYDYWDPVLLTNMTCDYKGAFYVDPVTHETFVSQPDFYYKCFPNSKSYDVKFSDPGGFLPKRLNGLYNVVLALEEDEEFGDMNANVIPWTVTSAGTEYKLKIVFPIIEVEFPSWDYPIAKILDFGIVTNVSITNITGIGNTRTIQQLTFTFDNTATKTIVFNNLPVIIETEGVLSNSDIKTSLQNLVTTTYSFGSWITRRLFRILTLIKKVYCALHKIRNLCEDYVKFSIVRQQEILLCADVAVEPAADLEAILAEIYFRVDSFLSPPVRFYNLLEMYTKGKVTEEIFNGYVLDHGFIDDKELKNSDLRTEVHTSDLYNIIMSIPGVVSIKHLQITNYLNGIPMTPGELWCLQLGGGYSLNLSKDSTTKIHFFRNGLEFFADKEQVALLIKTLQAENSKPKIKNSENDLPVPQGSYKNLKEYSSVQNDFPEIYKVGKNGIAKSDTLERIARVKQLKAFLLFFDQVLANFFGQMDLVKDLLSVDKTILLKETYSSQPVYDLNLTGELPNFSHIPNLLQDFTKTLPASTDLDDETSYNSSWKLFVEYGNNSFLTHLREINEDKQTFYKRRSVFLDHLIARFAENFSEYSIITHKMFKPITDDDLINTFTIIDFGGGNFGFQLWISGSLALENMAPVAGEENCRKTIRQVILNGMQFDNFKIDVSANFRFVLNDSNGIAIARHLTVSLNQQAAEAIIFSIIGTLSALYYKEQVDLIEDKRLFLDDYPRLSSQRGKGFTYKCCSRQEVAPGWPGDNISGLQRRVCRLLGINDPTDRLLVPMETDFRKVVASATTFKFKFKKNGVGSDLLENPAPNFLESDYTKIVFTVILAASNKTNYFNIAGNSFELRDKNGNVIAVPLIAFATSIDRDIFITELIAYFRHVYFQEGMHLIEHILLRPIKEGIITENDVDEGYFGLCKLTDDCDCPIDDQYSFRITIAIPYWPDRFRNMSFRSYAEKLIRYETPAHIMVKICWIDFNDMYELETLYLQWILLECQDKPNRTQLNDAISDLIKKINNMKNVYPEGVLHDCEHPSNDEAIILNQSSLGTLEDIENEE